ncbi:IS66 family transposase [Paraburkholderia sediminicola]|uniref:IS66 family transposase n=1 Tax=Paraburkholderia sediminicola TaxID=458836 RepID=UPI0038BDD0BA
MSRTGLPVMSEYSLNRWDALIYYCSDGVAEIDNLPAERASRGVEIGRRNYIFMGSDSGGERAASTYGLVGSARLNGIEGKASNRQFREQIAPPRITTRMFGLGRRQVTDWDRCLSMALVVL